MLALIWLLLQTICLEKAISNPNGHRPLDYPLVTSTSSKVIGAIEVKATNYLHRIAQNTVQCESILTNREKLFSESLLILRNSFFLKCFSDNNGSPIFQLSKQLVVVYGDNDMEARVEKVSQTKLSLVSKTKEKDIEDIKSLIDEKKAKTID
ncbi:hypothetical protein C2G38_2040502 [Gigaspora rosea]|uniref:Uncharacterized protein n=1 Tax=Gigaspora rosea TaxID=44941 RepID=A0A397UUV2_9GLOM|nr:hypothetical protein C2G38_2040502 [Gigaspora rosea]CAG8443893.1 25749_t:CDS:1 [Gigaspora rosea]